MGTAVAYTISENIIDISPVLAGKPDVCYTFVAAAFVGSLVWNVFTWIVKLPSSASHSMIGSMIGSGIAAYGFAYIEWYAIFYQSHPGDADFPRWSAFSSVISFLNCKIVC